MNKDLYIMTWKRVVFAKQLVCIRGAHRPQVELILLILFFAVDCIHTSLVFLSLTAIRNKLLGYTETNTSHYKYSV